jgi:hypothetical protein
MPGNPYRPHPNSDDYLLRPFRAGRVYCNATQAKAWARFPRPFGPKPAAMGFLIPAVHRLSSVICDVRRLRNNGPRKSFASSRSRAHLLSAICHALWPASPISLRRDESSLYIVKRSAAAFDKRVNFP